MHGRFERYVLEAVDPATASISREVKTGWTDALEREEGTLLGYEDWQNDIHMECHRKFIVPRRSK